MGVTALGGIHAAVEHSSASPTPSLMSISATFCFPQPLMIVSEHLDS